MEITESKYSNIYILFFSLLFILANALVVYFFGAPYVAFASFAFLILVIGIIAYDKLIYIVAFLTPLSLNLSYFIPNLPVDLSLFTEPLLLLILLIVTLKFAITRQLNLDVLKHPISIAIIINLIWIAITTATSTMPLVSFKFLLSRLWFVVPMFFVAISIFKDYSKIKPFLWAYGLSLVIIVIYSTYNLSQTSFLAQNAAHFVVKPFHKDHTIYGAATALFAPVFLGLVFNKKNKPTIRIIAALFAFIITIGVILSYSRAAWIGLVVATLVFVIIKLKIKFSYLLITAVVTISLVSIFWFQIIDTLEKNRQDTSSNLSEQIMSITNISTDASNKERLNRWYCAIQMFKEKPITGWGPGTYQFQYAPFQLKRMKTIISTDFGDVGNAHSEYLGPMAEQGVMGLISILILFTSIIVTGLRVVRNADNKEIKTLALFITLGFVTYIVHGFMNNFLDQDKIAVPFFGLAAILASLDIYHKHNSSL